MGDFETDEGRIYTFDQLIRQRALDGDQTPVFAYPKSRNGVSDYEFINGLELNRLVHEGANTFVRAELIPVVSFSRRFLQCVNY